MFAKKFLIGSIICLSLIVGLQNIVCADKIKVKVKNNYGERILELRENNHIIFNQDVPDHYLYTYHVDQLNGMEVEDDQAINDIHQAIGRSRAATYTYYESMEPGSDLYGSDTLAGATRIYAEYTDSLKNLLMYLNSAQK